MSASKAFQAYVKTPHYIEVEHETGCAYRNHILPLPPSECLCHCYIKAIFTAGYKAAKGIK